MNPSSPYAPPGAPNQPPGYPMAPYGPPPLRPGVLVERNSALVLVYSFVSCGIYALYWTYKTSEELRGATDDATINPGLDLLLTVLTCGVWTIYTLYRNAQKVQAILGPRDPNKKDQSQMVLMLCIANFFVGVTGFVAMFLVQEELNLLARASNTPSY
ncbi:MAG: DUF4234 domain-containing protein [Polyangiaceae bacterium]